MKRIIIIIIILSNYLYSQNNFGSSGSKLFFLNKNFGAIVQKNHTIAVTSDGAKSWKQIIIETDEELRKVLFTSESNGWLIGDKNLFNTIDSGNTWQKNISFGGNALYFINDKYGFIGGQGIYFTHNSGQTWTQSISDSMYQYPLGAMDFSFINDSIGIAINSFNVFITENGGNYWQRLPIYYFGTGNGAISSGKMLDEDNIILTAWYPAVWAVGYLLSSTDGGMNWSKFSNSFDWGIDDNYILNKDSIWLIAGSKVYVTTNGGIMWDTLDIQLNMFSFFTNHQAYGLIEKYVYYNVDSNSAYNIIDYLYYTEDGWRTYKAVDSIITGINETNKIPQSIKVYQNYPNPFNPVTTISFEIPKKEIVEVSIYNILGQKIETLIYKELKAGKHELIFNAEKLTSGVYFYQILTSNYQETKKCVLLK